MEGYPSLAQYSSDYDTKEIDLFLLFEIQFLKHYQVGLDYILYIFSVFPEPFLFVGVGTTWGCSVQNSRYLNQASPSCFKFEVWIAGNFLLCLLPLSFLCIIGVWGWSYTCFIDKGHTWEPFNFSNGWDLLLFRAWWSPDWSYFLLW